MTLYGLRRLKGDEGLHPAEEKLEVISKKSSASRPFRRDWFLVLNPRNTGVFLRLKTRPRRDFEPKSFF
jgi:hypothetical protein